MIFLCQELRELLQKLRLFMWIIKVKETLSNNGIVFSDVISSHILERCIVSRFDMISHNTVVLFGSRDLASIIKYSRRGHGVWIGRSMFEYLGMDVISSSYWTFCRCIYLKFTFFFLRNLGSLIDVRIIISSAKLLGNAYLFIHDARLFLFLKRMLLVIIFNWSMTLLGSLFYTV